MEGIQLKIKACIGLIKEEINTVEHRLKATFAESRHQLIQQGMSLLAEVPDMWLRAVLVILSAKSVSQADDRKLEDEDYIEIATAVELLHIAEMMHNGAIPAVEVLGSDISLVFGDYLYSQAYRLAAKCGNTDVSSRLSDVIDRACETELAGLCGSGSSEMQNDDAFNCSKTAIYFSTCCQVGAICGRASTVAAESLMLFGRDVGAGFDVLRELADSNDRADTQDLKAKAEAFGESAVKRLCDLKDSKYKTGLISITNQLSNC